ncbi:acid phosphatase type 7 isoform X1 [Protopterus annectens]|uniref:acid phosphatase type 7 isoform X1 n=1 Tax=Protopterus annectens TaxID=7888 RepID=UPI001CF9BAB8|nr:acid phosphatase type 7 isoform X1 [Protopterus annectens]
MSAKIYFFFFLPLQFCLEESFPSVVQEGKMYAATLTLLSVYFSSELILCIPPVGLQPEQVHISYPGILGSMMMTWTTFNRTDSVVEYNLWGAKLFELQETGSSTPFVDDGTEKRKLYIHRVMLNGLKSGATYVYHCGGEDGWSDMFAFSALKEGSDWSPRFAIFGDLGNENPQSLSRLQKETQQGMYDAILHVGDFAYDMEEDNARIGDEFMRQIESIAAYVPYMTCPGNHEQAYNFSNYKNRFSMPGDTEGLWYSWNIGPAHIISFSTEVYFYVDYGVDLIFKQYEWLKKDLEEANRPQNRKIRPWIITMGHRPMYCSNNDEDDCTKFESFVRLGRNDTKAPAPGLEKLFYVYVFHIWVYSSCFKSVHPVCKSFQSPMVRGMSDVTQGAWAIKVTSACTSPQNFSANSRTPDVPAFAAVAVEKSDKYPIGEYFSPLFFICIACSCYPERANVNTGSRFLTRMPTISVSFVWYGCITTRPVQLVRCLYLKPCVVVCML